MEAIDIMKTTLGEDHPSTLMGTRMLADIHFEQEQPECRKEQVVHVAHLGAQDRQENYPPAALASIHQRRPETEIAEPINPVMFWIPPSSGCSSNNYRGFPHVRHVDN